jgi:hypothetical protein
MRTFDTPVTGRAPRQPRAEDWPAPSLVADPPLAKAIGKVRELASDAAEAKAAAHEAAVVVERVEAEDLQRAADAIRAGSARPKPRRPAAQRKAEEAEREAQVMAIAARDAVAETLTALDARADALAARLSEAVAERLDAALAKLSEAGDALAEAEETMALHAWLSAELVAPWDLVRAKRGRLTRPRIARFADAPQPADLVDALIGAVEETKVRVQGEPETKGADVQPLRQHPMRGAA